METGKEFTISLGPREILLEYKGQYYLKIQPASPPSLGSNIVNWIFGQDLFHKYFTIFDVANMKIGFIEQATPEVILAREAAGITGGNGRYNTELAIGMDQTEEEMAPSEVRMSSTGKNADQSELSLTQAVPVSPAAILLLII